MGGGLSSKVKQGDFPLQKENQINVIVLYRALQKLTCAFGIKESLAESLIKKIIKISYKNVHDKSCSVAQWVKTNTEVELTAEEIYHLIKYVETFQLLAEKEEIKIPPALSSVDSVSQSFLYDSLTTSSRDSKANKKPHDRNILKCPCRSDIGGWILSIRQQEQKRNVFKSEEYNETHRVNSIDDNEERLATLRKRLSSF